MSPDKRFEIREGGKEAARHWENSKTIAGALLTAATILALPVIAMASQKTPDSKSKSQPTPTPVPTAQIHIVPETQSLSTDISIQIPLTATLEYNPR